MVNLCLFKEGISLFFYTIFFPYAPILGITGTFEGYTTTNAQIYNRGTFGSGYRLSDFTTNGDNPSITNDTSQLKVYLDKLDYTYAIGYNLALNFKTKLNSLINYSPYSKLYITFSYAYIKVYGSGISKDDSNHLYLITYNSNGDQIARTNYKIITGESSWEQGATEQTVSVDISSYNGVGGFAIYLYRNVWSISGGSTNKSKDFKHTAYIQRIYLA